MKLQTLNLKNFMGIKSLNYNFEGQNADIYGDNATGKTTIFNAVLWLLFDKNNENKSDFGIKTRVNGVEMSKMEHEVEAVFDVAGKEINLRKVYHEVWQKPKGKLTSEFKGNTSDYYVNDEPFKASEYKKFIASLCDEEVFKLVTNPLYFNVNLPWQKRREMILSICGNISDDEVIGSKKELAGLKDILNGGNVDSLIKIAKNKKAAIKKEIDELPVRISEVQNSIPADVPENKTELENNIHYVKEALETVNAQTAKVNSEPDNVGTIEEVARLRAQIAEERAKADSEANDKRSAIAPVLTAKREQNRALNNEKEDVLSKTRRMENDIRYQEKRRNELVEQFMAEKQKTFVEFEIENVCPTCGQELPTEKVEESKARLEVQREKFNVDKAERLATINNDGKENNANKVATEEEIRKLDVRRKEIDGELVVLHKEIDVLVDKYNEVVPDYTAVTSLESKLAELQKPDASAANVKAERLRVLRTQQEVQEGKLAGYQKQLAAYEMAENARNRIEELEGRESTLASQYEEYDRQIFLCESFTRQKVSLLESKINAKFRMANFTLFKENVTNDGIEECCETTFKGVPYTDLNNAARINVGLDIIKTLTEHYGFTAPIFVDNAEAVTKLIDMGEIQVIRLVVSGKDKALRLEITSADEKAGVA